MTKKELIELLEPYPDEIDVYFECYGEQYKVEAVNKEEITLYETDEEKEVLLIT